MPLNLGAVRAGIKQALGIVDNLNIYDYEAQNPELDAAVVRLPATIDPRQVFSDIHWNYEIPVTLMVGLSDAEAADAKLEAYLDEAGTAATSVIVALRVDKTFGGACYSSDVVSIDGFGLLVDNNAIACNITVEVMT